MIHHLDALSPGGALPMLTPPRHEITISPSVARKLELAYQRESLRICFDEQLTVANPTSAERGT